MNNTATRVGLALLVVAVVVGIVWFLNRRHEPEPVPGVASVESPESDQGKGSTTHADARARA
jgi:hypothetical protein